MKEKSFVKSEFVDSPVTWKEYADREVVCEHEKIENLYSVRINPEGGIIGKDTDGRYYIVSGNHAKRTTKKIYDSCLFPPKIPVMDPRMGHYFKESDRPKTFLLNFNPATPHSYGGSYESYDYWYPKAGAIVVERDKKLFIDGVQLLYEGPFVEWKSHPRGGVIVRNGSRWTYVKGHTDTVLGKDI